MQQDMLVDKLTEIVRDELEDRRIELKPGTELADIPGWDSVIMSAVLIQVERAYDVEFSPEEIDGISTVDGLLDTVRAKTKT